jgi:hypothetical protein
MSVSSITRQESVSNVACSAPRGFTRRRRHRAAVEESAMRDVIFIVLTLVIFAVFALIARGAEKL